jgi:hypothetical protein
MDDEVSHLCAALSNEPLFHLSLHSKELFHSNFLAWFGENYPSEASEAFSAWVPKRVGQSAVRVQREADHLDLAIELPGLAPFVVDNKVFAPPDEAQLDLHASGPMGGLDQIDMGGDTARKDHFGTALNGPKQKLLSPELAEIKDGM